MDKDKDFEEFWQVYQPDEIRFPNRKQASYREWCNRTAPARQAILAYVKDKGAPRWKNPYFFIQDYPEPEPTNLNGAWFFPQEPLVIAKYGDVAGIYTEREAMMYNMQIVKPFKP